MFVVVLSSVGLWLDRPALAHDSGPLASPAKPAEPARSAHGLPLRFEPNRGQLDARARFMARGQGYGLYLTDEGPTLALERKDTRAAVRMRVLGARRVEPRAHDELLGRSNYFVGDDASKWRANIESYARVRYEDVLPGIDVVYYGTDQQELEYDLVLGPGVDPKGVELAFDGVESVSIDDRGNAVLHLPGASEVVLERPFAYQHDDSGARVAVDASYQLLDRAIVGFRVGARDSTRPLVIDPVLQYSTYYGSSSFEEATATALDSAGNTYIVGYTSSILLPTVFPLQPDSGGGTYDAFICKLGPTGLSIGYATYLGGNGPDQAFGIATDPAGNAYVVGLTSSTNFPTHTPLQAASGGMQDAFVAKLNPGGSALVYSTYLGGSSNDYASGIAVNATGNAFLIGTTFSPNFPLAAALQPTLLGSNDAFVSKLSPAGTTLAYSTYLGGGLDDYGNGIAIDGSANAYVVGTTSSVNFPTAIPIQASNGGGLSDAFVSKLNASGSGLVYSTYLGGTALDEGLAIATNTAGAAHVAGFTTSTNFPTFAPRQANNAGNEDGFVSRLTPPGSAFAYSTYHGGAGNDRARGIAIDFQDTAHVAGSTQSTNFPTHVPFFPTNAGGEDAFLTRFDAAGQVLLFSTYYGGNGSDRAVGVAVNPSGSVAVVGSTLSTNLPMLSAAINFPPGSQDTFAFRLAAPPTVPATNLLTTLVLWAILLGGTLSILRPDRSSVTDS